MMHATEPAMCDDAAAWQEAFDTFWMDAEEAGLWDGTPDGVRQFVFLVLGGAGTLHRTLSGAAEALPGLRQVGAELEAPAPPGCTNDEIAARDRDLEDHRTFEGLIWALVAAAAHAGLIEEHMIVRRSAA